MAEKKPKYTAEELHRADDTMKMLSAMPKEEQTTAVALVNAFIAGMEAQKLAGSVEQKAANAV